VDPEARDRWLEHAQRRAAQAGMRAGAVRMAVMELLARDGQCLISAAQVTARLREGGIGSTASVYRALDQLHALGLLRRVDEGRLARYEIADPLHHHHHAVDERTGEIVSFSDAALEAAIEAVAARLGFALSSHDVVLRGQRR
jgi:Fur family ferric uptake transcriptional regulator